jgi:N-succinyldiaminopimelate aminotransferase
MVATLAACGLKPTTPAGSFFILTDISSMRPNNGREFCNDLARDIGVVPVPTDPFYHHQHYGEKIVRFTFCLRRQMLETARTRLAKLQLMCGAER